MRILKLVALMLLVFMATACTLTRNQQESPIEVLQAPSATPTETVEEEAPRSTPQPTMTPSRTLRPPPTFEPPTLTPTITPSPTITLSPTIDLFISIPGLRGAETATPTSTAGCSPREDWKLTYRVKFGDAIANIAQTYGTFTRELAEGNCITDPNKIVEGQLLRVPGAAHPVQPRYECMPYEILTPFNGTNTVPDTGSLVFNWIGPRVPHTLIRIYRPGKDQVLDGSQIEIAVELRQNETIQVEKVLPWGGTYTWELYPLDENFVQIDCPKGGPWRFSKAESPPPTPTIDFTQP